MARDGRRGVGCGTIAMTLLAVSILLLVGCGVYLWVMVPKWWKSVDENAVPWVESKGRALVGKFTMRPMYCVLEQSDLTADEKSKWAAYLDASWELAWTSDDQALKREELINIALDTAATQPGYYYMLLYIMDECMDDHELSRKNRKDIKIVLQRAAYAMADGSLKPEELAPVRKELMWVATGIRKTGKSEASKRQERSVNLKDASRHIYALLKDRPAPSEIHTAKMPQRLRDELSTLRFKIESIKTEDSIPDPALQEPVPKLDH